MVDIKLIEEKRRILSLLHEKQILLVGEAMSPFAGGYAPSGRKLWEATILFFTFFFSYISPSFFSSFFPKFPSGHDTGGSGGWEINEISTPKSRN